jgi:Spy/CpxP family protein refolding chaperone
MTTTVRTMAGALLFVCASAVARGQGPPEGPPPAGAREEAGRMVDAYILSNMQESLGLSDDQFVKLLPVVKRLQSERRDSMERRMRALRGMRRLLKSGSATEGEVLAQLSEFKAAEADGPARLHREMEAIDALLSPLQQAKFRVFEAEVGMKLRELTFEMRRQNRNEGRMDEGRPRRPGQP